MKNNIKIKKQISFDLDTNNLKKYYPKPKDSVSEDYYKKAYKDIQDFMLKNDFEHRQGSIYVSKEKLFDVSINVLIENMSKNFKWFYKVVNSFDVTDVGKRYSLMQLLEEYNRLLEYTEEFNVDEAAYYRNDDTVKRLEDDWDLEI